MLHSWGLAWNIFAIFISFHHHHLSFGISMASASSSGNTLEQQSPDPLDPVQSADNLLPKSFPVKRALPINLATGKYYLLFENSDRGINETRDLIQTYSTNRSVSLQTTDFIVRMQEAYAYQDCESYLRAVPGVHNIFFRTLEPDLVNIANSPEEEQFDQHPDVIADRKRRAAETLNKRYRLYDEPCSMEQEWNFWRDMFTAALNDSEDKRSGQDNREHLMKQWNEIWISYQQFGVCNQRLLLECSQKDPNSNNEGVCKCRSHAVGLALMANQQSETTRHLHSFLTFQYYEDQLENNHGEIRRHDGRYVHKKKCVLSASFPFVLKDLPLINPCDFYMPMIGLCHAECQRNATCKSVAAAEKDRAREQVEKDFYQRMINRTVHSVYDNRCVCNRGQSCRKQTNVTFGGATSFLEEASSYYWKGGVILAILQIILLSF